MHPNNEPVGVKVVPMENPIPLSPTPPQTRKQKFVKKSINHFTSKMFLVDIVIAIALSVAEIIYGQQYSNQCPISPYIPSFLLVHGLTKIIWAGFSIIARIQAKHFSNSIYISILILINVIIQVIFFTFFFIWFSIGNMLVWSINETHQSTDPSDTSTYCQSKLYEAAQDLVITTYILVGMATVSTIKRRLISKLMRRIENIDWIKRYMCC